MTARIPATSPAPVWLWPVVVMLVGGLLRGLWPTSQSVWYDEGTSLWAASAPDLSELTQRIFVASASERFQPLHLYLLWCWQQLFGPGELAARLLSILLGAAVLPAWWWATRHLLTASARLLGLIILALMPLAVLYSQEIRPYNLVLLSATLLLGCLSRLAATPGWRHRWLLPAVVALGLLSNLLFVIPLAGLLVGFYLAGGRLRFRTLFTVVRVTAMLVGWYLYLRLSLPTSGVASAPGLPLMNLAYGFYSLLLGTTWGPPLADMREGLSAAITAYLPALALAGVCLASVGLLAQISCLKPRAADATLHPARWAWGGLLIGLLSAGAFATVTKLQLAPRHLLGLLPLIALGLALLRSITLGPWVLTLWAILAALSNVNYFTNPRYARDDYRAVAAEMRQLPPGWSAALGWGNIQVFDYYGVHPLNLHGQPPAQFPMKLHAIAPNAAGFLLAINRPYYWSPTWRQDLQQNAPPGYEILDLRTTPHFALARYHRTP